MEQKQVAAILAMELLGSHCQTSVMKLAQLHFSVVLCCFWPRRGDAAAAAPHR